MVHKKSLRALEIRKALKKGYYDRERAEKIALRTYPIVDIRRGEVLFSPIYLHPSLK